MTTWLIINITYTILLLIARCYLWFRFESPFLWEVGPHKESEAYSKMERAALEKSKAKLQESIAVMTKVVEDKKLQLKSIIEGLLEASYAEVVQEMEKSRLVLLDGGRKN